MLYFLRNSMGKEENWGCRENGSISPEKCTQNAF